ncbi:MAG: Ig domain-containing protein [Bacteroidales bacterium]|nr:Ig domain-containing protein [Bacteroidales bacterium]
MVVSATLFLRLFAESVGFFLRLHPLAATVAPANASNKNVTWSSSNTAVATVDNNGKVRPKAVGTTIITVKTVNGGFTATCKIQVMSSVSGHDFVDLGLPSGMLWATTNVGASKPEDNGNYYGWGMTDMPGIFHSKERSNLLSRIGIDHP